MKLNSFYLLLFATCFLVPGSAQNISVSYKYNSNNFPLVMQSKTATIFIDSSDHKVVSIAAKALQEDIHDISDQTPVVSNSNILLPYSVIIGTIGHSKLIDSLIQLGKINVDAINNKWEAYTLQIINHPFKNVKQALIIAGADRRGTAYGVFELSKLLGVSPWKWWADVHPEKHSFIYLS